MVQLCSRFNRATKLVNFDGAVTGLNDVRERLGKTDRAFFVCLFVFPHQSSVSKSLAGQRPNEPQPQTALDALPPSPFQPCKQARE